MNDVAMMDKNLSVDRTPELIAIEINSIKEQTRKMVLFNSIEIGRRLTEAKLLIKHGEWGEWLSKSVDYSQRTASNLMAIFEQYGSSQITLFCDNAKSQALANLSYTQAVALLGIPQGEREAFIEEHDIDNMSTRELQQAIKEKQDLEAKVMELEVAWGKDKSIAEEKSEEARKLLDEKQSIESSLRVTDKVLRDTQADVKRLQDALKKEKEESKEEIERLELSISETKRLLSEAKSSGNDDEIDRLSESLVKSDSELTMAQQKIEELERQLKEPIEVTAAPIIEKVPEEVEQELQRLRERTKELEAKGSQQGNAATIRFRVYLDSLVTGFKDLLGVLAELKELDTELHERYRTATVNLISKMSERL